MQDDVKNRLKPTPYVRDPAERAEKDAMLPGLNSPYKAAGTPDNGEVSRLVVIMGRDGFKPGGKPPYRFLQYVHIGLGDLGFDADGQSFSFVFSDLQPKLVTVHGRNLLRICDYISLRRLPWIRVADRDFRSVDGAEDSEPIITKIEVVDWKRAEGD